ncbi:F0F1 ATP synthase subunit delta [Fangia hongkongensis]|uniref:F0F1 ATP synthase subunit delta n=1 Tax=Fangia hongkongensis TaxID=270495 RepID=UPI00035F3353|nr:F0F1 ATP synthase subunit delta [Fangia hongkongensis]MBK2125694.1 F0F1 ATP synthase subunit delta [Fangia hongkongensis]
MADMTYIARPYARAAYEFARDKKEVNKWTGMLLNLAECIENQSVQALIDDPNYAQSEVARFVISVLDESLDQHAKNFILVVSEHNRLAVIPWIYALFLQYKAEDEKAKTAKITTAFEATDQDIEKLKQQLEKKYNCAVQVETAVDTALIGGAIIEIGDVVIDGSIKGRLDKLQHVLQA